MGFTIKTIVAELLMMTSGMEYHSRARERQHVGHMEGRGQSGAGRGKGIRALGGGGGEGLLCPETARD